MKLIPVFSPGKSKALSALDASKTRNSQLGKLRSEQNAAAKHRAKWNPSESQTNVTGSELHTADSDLLHQGHDITWLERVTAQVYFTTRHASFLELLISKQRLDSASHMRKRSYTTQLQISNKFSLGTSRGGQEARGTQERAAKRTTAFETENYGSDRGELHSA